jgi:YbbR domain-containing protein
MKKYEVKMTSDAVGYYVVEVEHGIEGYIQGTSMNKKEMIELAKKLTIRAELKDIESKSIQGLF